MVALTFTRTVQSGELILNAGESFVFSLQHAVAFIEQFEDCVFEQTDIDSYMEEIPRPSSFEKKRVLLYDRGAQGDHFMLTAAIKFFHDLGALTYVACYPHQMSIFKDNHYLASHPLVMPVAFDSVWRKNKKQFFHYTFFLENIHNSDDGPEQPNSYDRLFSALGFDPETIPDSEKIPNYTVLPEEKVLLDEFLLRRRIKGYIVFQPIASTGWKSMPLFVIRTVLEVLNKIARDRGFKIMVCHHKQFEDDVRELIKETSEAINFAEQTQDIRSFATLISGAECVICPDSSSLHIAAALSVPSLSFFGAHSPESRAKYYPLNKSIWHQEKCENSPCFYYADKLPYNKCPNGKKQVTCECYEGITSKEVEDALEDLWVRR